MLLAGFNSPNSGHSETPKALSNSSETLSAKTQQSGVFKTFAFAFAGAQKLIVSAKKMRERIIELQ